MTANIYGSSQAQAVPHEFAKEALPCQSREEKVSSIGKQTISSTSLPPEGAEATMSATQKKPVEPIFQYWEKDEGTMSTTQKAWKQTLRRSL